MTERQRTKDRMTERQEDRKTKYKIQNTEKEKTEREKDKVLLCW